MCCCTATERTAYHRNSTEKIMFATCAAETHLFCWLFSQQTYREHFLPCAAEIRKSWAAFFTVSSQNSIATSSQLVSFWETSIFLDRRHFYVDSRAQARSIILGSMTIIHFALETSKTIKNEAAQCPGKPLSGDSPLLFSAITIIFYLFCAAALCVASPSAVIINMYSSFVTFCIPLEWIIERVPS